MALLITGKLVDIRTKETVGYKIITDKDESYSAVVSLDKLKELAVQDASIVQYMDFEEIEVILSRNNKYGVIDRSKGFSEELADIPYEEVFGVAVYGYLFNENELCPIDNEFAINRLKHLDKGGVLYE